MKKIGKSVSDKVRDSVSEAAFGDKCGYHTPLRISLMASASSTVRSFVHDSVWAPSRSSSWHSVDESIKNINVVYYFEAFRNNFR